MPLDPKAIAALKPQARSLALIQQEEAAKAEAERQKNEALAGQLELMSQAHTASLAPAAAGLDSLFGSNLSPTFANIDARQAAEEKALQDRLNKPEQKVSPLELAAYRSLISDGNTRADTRKDVEAEKRKEKLEADIQKAFDKDIINPINERRQQFANIEDAINTGDLSRVTAVLAQFARGVSGEKGVLTDPDIARVFPRTGAQDVQGVIRYLTQKGSVTPEIQAMLKGAVATARKNARSVYGDFIEQKSKAYGDRSSAKEFNVYGPEGFGTGLKKTARETLDVFAPADKEPPPVSDKVKALLEATKGSK